MLSNSSFVTPFDVTVVEGFSETEPFARYPGVVPETFKDGMLSKYSGPLHRSSLLALASIKGVS